MSKPPRRIRLSRAKGFNLQAASMALNGLPAVNCARPAAWGNPYPVAVFGRELAVALFRNSVQGFWSPGLFDGIPDAGTGGDLIDKAYEIHRTYLYGDVRQLRGQNVACVCDLDELCHGDVLIELANEE